LIQVAKRRQKDKISILKKNRNLETNSSTLKDAAGQATQLAGPHIAVQDLVTLIPASAYREIQVGEKSYWIFTITVRIQSLGKVRIVISYE
jgi:hypothetical protein